MSEKANVQKIKKIQTIEKEIENLPQKTCCEKACYLKNLRTLKEKKSKIIKTLSYTPLIDIPAGQCYYDPDINSILMVTPIIDSENVFNHKKLIISVCLETEQEGEYSIRDFKYMIVKISIKKDMMTILNKKL